MLLKIEKEKIIDALQKALNLIPGKIGTAYLRSLWLKAEDNSLTILATDSSIEFYASYKTTITETGFIGVQAKYFVDLIRKLPNGLMTFKLDDQKQNLCIEQGKRKYKLPVNESNWFKNFSSFPETDTVIWSGDFLSEIIDKVSFCISDSDNVEAISCLYLKKTGEEEIESCGLNGLQFALLKFNYKDLANILPEQGFLIQKKYLVELKKWLSSEEIEIGHSEKRLFFRSMNKNETFSLPLSNYQYPDYNNFLSKFSDQNISTLKVNRREILDALDRLSIFNESNTLFEFDFDLKDELFLSSLGQEVGSANENIKAEYSGKIQKITFFTKKLIDALNHYQSEEITFLLTENEGPCGIKGNNENDYLVVVMPLKVAGNEYFDEE